MKRRIITTGIVLLTIIALWGSQALSVPPLINYQGRLTDTTGQPKSGTFIMKFRVYDAALTGTFKWGEEQQVVKVNNGIFNVLLGSGQGIDEAGTILPDQTTHQDDFKAVFDGANVWLEVQVDPDNPMQPRQQIVSVGYAFSSKEADHALNADNATNANYATSSGSASSADIASSADYATSAGSASSATNANYATSSGSASQLSSDFKVVGSIAYCISNSSSTGGWEALTFPVNWGPSSCRNHTNWVKANRDSTTNGCVWRVVRNDGVVISETGC